MIIFLRLPRRVKESLETRREGIKTILPSFSSDDPELLPILEEPSHTSLSTDGALLSDSLNKPRSSSSPTRPRGGQSSSQSVGGASASTRASVFWQSKQGKQSAQVVPSSPPPLDYRPLDWSIREGDRSASSPPVDRRSDEEYDGGEGKAVPVGSALHAARKKKVLV
jgi:hypothetical protein